MTNVINLNIYECFTQPGYGLLARRASIIAFNADGEDIIEDPNLM